MPLPVNEGDARPETTGAGTPPTIYVLPIPDMDEHIADVDRRVAQLRRRRRRG